MKLIYVLVYFLPGSFDPVETGMQFDTLAECNDAAFEMAASFDMKYTLQCVPQNSGDSLLKSLSLTLRATIKTSSCG